MTIEELKGADWLPNRYKLAHCRGFVLFSTMATITLVFLVCSLIMLFSDLISGFVLSGFTAIFAIISLFLKRKVGYRYELHSDGIYLYKQKELNQVIPYGSITHINNSITKEDLLTDVSTLLVSKGRCYLNLTTLYCYNETGKLLLAMPVDRLNELPLVLAMLSTYHPFLDDSLDLLTERELNQFVKGRTEMFKTYQKYERYVSQPPFKLVWVYVLHWFKISVFSILPFFLLGAVLGNLPSSVPLALMEFISACSAFSFLVAPFTFAFYFRTRNVLYQYH